MCLSMRRSEISIHVPAWGTTAIVAARQMVKKISIHVPAWGTTVFISRLDLLRIFQSTFPRGERLYIRCFGRKPCDFNPRSRVGNDVLFLCNPASRKISIHVPAWGTTVVHWTGHSFQSISIHVPAWGTTEPGLPSCQKYGYFNPRSRVGNDRCIQYAGIQLCISIHVPAWGTTCLIWLRLLPFFISIHVPAWGTTERCRLLSYSH